MLPRIFFLVFMLYSVRCQVIDSNRREARIFIDEYNHSASETCNRLMLIRWKVATNNTEYNRQKLKEQEKFSQKFNCISSQKAKDIFNPSEMDGLTRRQFELIIQSGNCGLSEGKLLEFYALLEYMAETFSSSKTCPFTRTISHPLYAYPYDKTGRQFCNLKVDPDLVETMAKTRSEQEMKYTYMSWREEVSMKMKNSFMRQLEIANQNAKAFGFSDVGDMSRATFDDEHFRYTVDELWAEIQPMYKELFAFVRRGLVQSYGNGIIRVDGPIPAHLLGDVWSYNWQNIIETIHPFAKDLIRGNVELTRQGYTPNRMLQTAELFFTSMGFPPMSPEFWRNSDLRKANENNGSKCKSTSWDFCNGNDFRIHYCGKLSIDDFIDAHREMTNVHYFMQYASQPFSFRSAVNDAFKIATSEAVALNAGGINHLHKLALISTPDSLIENENSSLHIEHLLYLALNKLPFLAFHLSAAMWKWDVATNGPEHMNSKWWELQLRNMGLIPPSQRSPRDFDAAAYKEILSGEDPIKYFVATVLEFQIQSELCQSSGHLGPLHKCDFYKSREAGRILMDIMQRGASLPANEILRHLTRGKTNKLSAAALLEYFHPLYLWLQEKNRKEGELVIGWNSNADDVKLFKSLGSQRSFSAIWVWIFVGSFLFLQ